jgi:hypothetical protein
MVDGSGIGVVENGGLRPVKRTKKSPDRSGFAVAVSPA